MKCTQQLQAADSWGIADVRDGGELVISQIEIDNRAAVCWDVLKLGAWRKKNLLNQNRPKMMKMIFVWFLASVFFVTSC